MRRRRPSRCPAAVRSGCRGLQPRARRPAAPRSLRPLCRRLKAAAVGSRTGPAGLTAPRGGKADNLKEIEGIGPAMEKLVNEHGLLPLRPDRRLERGRCRLGRCEHEGRSRAASTRDRWVAQAKIIVTEGLEAFRNAPRPTTTEAQVQPSRSSRASARPRRRGLVGIVLAGRWCCGWGRSGWADNWAGRRAMCSSFDLAAIAAFVWALVVTYQIWRGRRG